LASGSSREFKISHEELDENLLWWLRTKGITIASSCGGEGVCKKCVIQNGWMTCMMTIRTFLKDAPSGVIEVSYL
jgi:Na+-transporting NADH:ubiquinone oxidoreductase subunit NqrF